MEKEKEGERWSTRPIEIALLHHAMTQKKSEDKLRLQRDGSEQQIIFP